MNAPSAAAATPFRKVLIANRGEIALRVMRSAHARGLATVAVHSSADAGAPHVLAAGQAVAIGGARPAESYLSIAAILEAARRSGADAVHPGYGFLAENAAFARACREAGLVFIGPPAEAIEAMGDKAAAKRLMRAAGVPCIPGADGADQDPRALAAVADAIGYPVMIKASAGGGGRGMRLVHAPAGFAAAVQAARSEAEGAFGDGTLILECALLGARHIEVQVFADRHGQAIHLGERDCSVQRRHQKLIEEAPSPAVDAALRARLGASALAALRAVAYEGAGTVEFLLDAEGRHFFMEMNTRLQVEHPVTEAITGIDLVDWQLRIAAGEPLPLAQEAIRFDGHAIEVRLCAEDPAQGFMPQSGRIALWAPPAGVRVEHALACGIEVLPYYDSMLAKVVVHGRDRETARRQLAAALEQMVVLGLATNREFLLRCLHDPVFAAGGATTAFIDERGPALAAPTDAAHADLIAVAALLLFQCDAVSGTGHARDGVFSHPLAHRWPLPMRFDAGVQAIAATVTRTAPRSVAVEIDATRHSFELVDQGPSTLRFRHHGVEESTTFAREGEALWLQMRGRTLRVLDRTRAAPARDSSGTSDGTLRASMTGRVVALLATPGASVQAGAPLVTLEAMKMEHVHSAPWAGQVVAVHVSVGDQVSVGRLLVELA